LGALFAKFRRTGEPGTLPRVPAGQRVYCIGDIHGRLDLLLDLHHKIRADVMGFAGKKTVVYLGDYIDRGEQSRQVIDLLLTRPLADIEAIYLLGNHEQTMLDFMAYPEAAAVWLDYGGRECLYSYGITLMHIPTGKEVLALAARLRETLPKEHHAFFDGCANNWLCGDYYFAHAGIRPGVALHKQLREDQIWIRDEFLLSDRDHGAVVVHGHSITTQPELLPNRIDIDTGAYASGILTCLVLEGEVQRFIQTGQGA